MSDTASDDFSNAYERAETLDPMLVNMGDEYVMHNRSGMSRIVPITNINNKNYYFITEFMDSNSLYLKQDPVKKYNIKLVMYKNKDLIEEVNKFKSGIADRIRGITRIPVIKDSNKLSFFVNSYKNLQGKYMIRNILQYINCKTSLDANLLKIILSKCECKFMFQVIALIITSDNVYFRLRLSRVIPRSLDSLDISDKTLVYNMLNSGTIQNMENLRELEKISVDRRATSKKKVRDELKSILC